VEVSGTQTLGELFSTLEAVQTDRKALTETVGRLQHQELEERARLSGVRGSLDQIERLQGRHNVLGLDGGQGADVFNRDVGPVLLDGLEDHPHPVAAEADLSFAKSKTG
jgi:hypothetical protein